MDLCAPHSQPGIANEFPGDEMARRIKHRSHSAAAQGAPVRTCAGEQRIGRDNLTLQPLHACQSLEIEWSCGKDKALLCVAQIGVCFARS